MSTVIGIDGCRSGWLTTRILDDKSLSFHVIKNLKDSYLKDPNLTHVGIDMPLGLSPTGKRPAEVEARFLLKKRSCTIFSPPTIGALECESYLDACEINFRDCGNRISKQSWNLFPKIKETQKFLKNKLITKPSIYEIHPELSFMAMNNMKVIELSKKTDLGRKIRIKLIQKFFPNFRFELVRSKYKKNEVLDDDILDSISVLWSTLRIVDNIAQFVPKDSKKLNMRIYF